MKKVLFVVSMIAGLSSVSAFANEIPVERMLLCTLPQNMTAALIARNGKVFGTETNMYSSVYVIEGEFTVSAPTAGPGGQICVIVTKK